MSSGNESPVLKSTHNSTKTEPAIGSQRPASESVSDGSQREAEASSTPIISTSEQKTEQKETDEREKIEVGGMAEHVAKALVEEIRRLMCMNKDTGSGVETQKHSPEDAGAVGNEDIGNVPTSAKPTLERSWEVITKEVTALDEGQVGGWKEDIDTLLVFAGLFSAVVTAFTIESYQWLREAPEDTTVFLLQSIYRQSNSTIPEPEAFVVSSVDVKINILWFLSLIIALVDALFALLCKQWLREHRRHTHTRTPGEALALSWLRQQSLDKWHVHSILASLPMLLELAVFLFLAGMLVLLWDRHRIVFGIASVVVGLAGLFYLGTTIIPTVNIVRQALQVTWGLWYMRLLGHTPQDLVDFIMSLPPMEYTCPYKSPQAWAVFQILKLILRIPGAVRALYFLCRKNYASAGNSTWMFDNILSSLSSWSTVDLEIIQRSSVELAPPMYELNAFRWLVAELRDSPIMIPHLQNVLRTLPIHLVMPAVLDQWFGLPHREWTDNDIVKVLLNNNKMKWPEYQRATFVGAQRETRLFNRLLHVIHLPNDMNFPSLPQLVERLKEEQRSTGIFNCIGLPIQVIDKLYQYDKGELNQLLHTLPDILVDLSIDKGYLHGLVMDLSSYIIASSSDYALHNPKATTTSSFVRSAAILEHLSKIDIIVKENWYDPHWLEAMDIVRRIHGLNEDHFKPHPNSFPLPLLKLRKTLDSISPTDLGLDFGYLESFSRSWSNVDTFWKSQLVEILSNHIIDYPQSNMESPNAPLHFMISPLVLSSPGLDLITFINNQLAEDREMYESLSQHEPATLTAWREVIEQTKNAYPELSRDHFVTIFHEGIDTLSSKEERQRGTEDLGVPFQPERALEAAEDCPATSRVSSLETGENTSLPADRNLHKGESISMALMVPRDSVSQSRIEHGELGGLGADKNV